MQLGSILDGAKHRPSVVEPVKFKVGTMNAQAQKTSAEASAVLVYVSDEEIQDLTVAADKSLSDRFKERPPAPGVRDLEVRVHFLAVALRDESDPAKPFVDGGPSQLRDAILPSVGDDLMDKYRAFIGREYHVRPTDAEIEKLKEQAAGK